VPGFGSDVPGERERADLLGGARRRAGAADRDAVAVGHRPELGGGLAHAPGRDRAQGDELGSQVARRPPDRVERRVAAEVADPPAAGAEYEAEGDEAELVLLARQTG
jgi:hypothetical protein